MMRPLAHLKAFVLGYFWLPCPVCGRKFGGHEAGSGTLYHDDGCNTGRLTCPNCPGAWVHGPDGWPVRPASLLTSKKRDWF